MTTIETLATASKASLTTLTVKELRALASGQLTGFHKLKKGALIDALLTKGQELRETAAKVTAATQPKPGTETEKTINPKKAAANAKTTSVGLGEYVGKLAVRFKGIVSANVDPTTGSMSPNVYADIAGLSASIVTYLSMKEGQQSNGKTAVTTQLRDRTHIMNALTASLETEKGSALHNSYTSSLEILNRALTQALKEMYKTKEYVRKQDVAKRKDEKTPIDDKTINTLIALARGVLLNLEGMKKRDWSIISVALATVTGRRMAEIHGEKTQFEVDGDGLMFTGQLKAKGVAKEYYDKNPSYKIPCLIEPGLVVAGHAWLRKHGKLESDPAKAHNRFSRYVSAKTKAIFSEAGIGGSTKKHTYKGLRQIYCQYSFQQSGANDEAAYIAKILGHGRQDMLNGGRLADFNTPQAYNSDWELTGTTSQVKNLLGSN